MQYKMCRIKKYIISTTENVFHILHICLNIVYSLHLNQCVPNIFYSWKSGTNEFGSLK